MDLHKYFEGIRFKLVGKENGLYLHEARISSGDEMVLRVAASNRTGKYLSTLKWKFIWGLVPRKALSPLPFQGFSPPVEMCRDKTLTLHGRDPNSSTYMSDVSPYIVILPHGEDMLDPYDNEDRLTLIDALGSPEFVIRRFA